MQLGLEEVAAGVPDVGELEQVGGRQQGLDILLRHLHLGRVHVLHQRLQRLRVHLVNKKDNFSPSNKGKEGAGIVIF